MGIKTRYVLTGEARKKAIQIAGQARKEGNKLNKIADILKTNGIHLPGGKAFSAGTVLGYVNESLHGSWRAPKARFNSSKKAVKVSSDHKALLQLVFEADLPKKTKLALLEKLL